MNGSKLGKFNVAQFGDDVQAQKNVLAGPRCQTNSLHSIQKLKTVLPYLFKSLGLLGEARVVARLSGCQH
jgi:hypothetical protein